MLSASAQEKRARAIKRLAIDAATAEVNEALRTAGIRALLLKGAAIAHRLYEDPAQRTYDDFDLLVEPERFDEAAGIVAGMGYIIPLRTAAERWEAHAVTCRRGMVTLDLHHRFLLGADPGREWATLSADAGPLRLGGGSVDVLSDPALGLVITGHLVHHGSAIKPRRDLERALDRFAAEAWVRARHLAAHLGTLELLAAGLREDPRGRRLASELDLPVDSGVLINVKLAGHPPLPGGFVRLAQARSPIGATRLIAAGVVPSAQYMRYTRRFARRGRRALVLAYLHRPLWLAAQAPRVLRRMQGARRPARGGGTWIGPADLRAAAWTWRAGRSVRRQLRAGGLDAVSLPPVPRVGAAAVRGVRATLARQSLSCLERSLVRQRWHAAHGDRRDLVIGVHGPHESFGAHAWLEGDPELETQGFAELLRRPAR